MRVYELTDTDLPEVAWPLREVFGIPAPTMIPKDFKKSDRRRGESLHDYLARKNVKCFCRNCVADRKKLSDENNGTLL